VLTYPAEWGRQRTDLLTQAAAEAGTGPVTLVPEPVASAAHFTHVLRHPVQPGEAPKMWNSIPLNYNDVARDQPVGFQIRWPAPGRYALQVLDTGRLGNESPPPGGLAELPFTLS
jgi:hypothetical protein